MFLSKKQLEALSILQDSTTNELIFGGGAGGMKTYTGCHFILKSVLKYPNTRHLIGRARLSDLKGSTLKSLFEVFAHHGIKPVHYNYNAQSNEIKFFNGSEIILKDLEYAPSDPEFSRLGSYSLSSVFVDECNEIEKKAWDILKSRIRHNLSANNLIPKILGTCNPSKNWVYTDFYKPSKDGTLPPNKKFLQSLALDNPFREPTYIDQLKSLGKGTMERLLLGNWDWDEDDRALVDVDAINDCFNNVHVKPTDDKRLSADIALMGRDRFVVSFFRGDVVQIVIDKLKAEPKEVEQDLVFLMEQFSVPPSKVIADSDGLGQYLHGYIKGIKTFHAGSAAINKEMFANLKSECAYKLAEKINKRQLKIICTDEQKQRIIEEFGVLKASSVNNDTQKKSLIKKDEMKTLLSRSPDYMESILMGMLTEISKKKIVLVNENILRLNGLA